MPPDKHATSPEQPKRRRDGEPKIIPSPQAVIERSGRAFDDLLERAGGREVRAFDDAARQEDCQVVEVAHSRPSPASVRWSDIRQSTGVVTGGGLPSRGNAAARSEELRRRAEGRGARGWQRRSRPLRVTSALSSGRRSTIRTGDPDRV